jgi:LysM repeat protein
MKSFRQVLLGFMVAFASIGLIIGSFSLSLAEGKMNSAPLPTQTVQPTGTATLQPATPTRAAPTPSLTRTHTRTPSWTPGLTLTPTPTICELPAGWVYYIVKPGDTLDTIGATYRISSDELQQANCLQSPDLLPGSGIYVPPLLSTQTRAPCGAPYNWIIYIVQPGDTLYRLSLAYGITVADLQSANCLGSSTLLQVGQRIYVPPWAAHTPTPTLPWIVTPVDTLTSTPEITTPTVEPTQTPTSVPTEIPSETPTEIPTTSTP